MQGFPYVNYSDILNRHVNWIKKLGLQFKLIWTGQQVQFRWEKLMHISSSH